MTSKIIYPLLLALLCVSCSSSNSDSSGAPSDPIDIPNDTLALQIPKGRQLEKRTLWMLKEENGHADPISVRSMSWCEFDGTTRDDCALHLATKVVQGKRQIISILSIDSVATTSSQKLKRGTHYSIFRNMDDSTVTEKVEYEAVSNSLDDVFNSGTVEIETHNQVYNLDKGNLAQAMLQYYETYRCVSNPVRDLFVKSCPMDSGNYFAINKSTNILEGLYEKMYVAIEFSAHTGNVQSLPLIAENESRAEYSLGNSSLVDSSDYRLGLTNLGDGSFVLPSKKDIILGAIGPQYSTRSVYFAIKCDRAYNEIDDIPEVVPTQYEPAYSKYDDVKASKVSVKDYKDTLGIKKTDSLILDLLSQTQLDELYFDDTLDYVSGFHPDHSQTFPLPPSVFLQNQKLKGGPCEKYY